MEKIPRELVLDRQFYGFIELDDMVVNGLYEVEARNYCYALWNGHAFEAWRPHWGGHIWDECGLHCQQPCGLTNIHGHPRGGDVYPLRRLPDHPNHPTK